mmetsp:Transcript_10028/g.22015  ORF Transcript_10028/g.22015 Transcript_10028/m.22015 type:complete len:83 (-) Transcript_10028:527-775(-)
MIASDRLTLSDGINEWSVLNQVFGNVSSEDGNVFNELPFEGIMGIGKHILTLNKHRNVLENLLQAGCLRKHMLSFDLNDKNS